MKSENGTDFWIAEWIVVHNSSFAGLQDGGISG